LSAIRKHSAYGTEWFHFAGGEYLDLMRRVALLEYLAMRGNRGAWCLCRTEAEVTHFEMLTFWDDTDAIKRFAGGDYGVAAYRLRFQLSD
jgi:hypothetical protein